MGEKEPRNDFQPRPKPTPRPPKKKTTIIGILVRKYDQCETFDDCKKLDIENGIWEEIE